MILIVHEKNSNVFTIIRITKSLCVNIHKTSYACINIIYNKYYIFINCVSVYNYFFNEAITLSVFEWTLNSVNHDFS